MPVWGERGAGGAEGGQLTGLWGRWDGSFRYNSWATYHVCFDYRPIFISFNSHNNPAGLTLFIAF